MKERNFKPLTQPNTNTLSNKGKALPVVKSLVELGLTEASANGEAVITRKTKTNPKGSGRKPKIRDKTFYPNHKFIELYPKIFLVLKPDSQLDVSNYADFIHASENSDDINDVVDILPPLYDMHYKLIADSKTRFMVGDIVTVNFKFRSIDEVKKIVEKTPTKIKKVKFTYLVDMTVVTAELETGINYLIHELDHYVADKPTKTGETETNTFPLGKQ